jgi:toxin ParE1/3/4
MAYRIFWTPIAVQDLRDICDFISRDNLVAAPRLGKELIKQSEAMAAFPQSGRMVPEKKDPLIRETLVGSYRIIYRFDESKKVVALAVAAEWRAIFVLISPLIEPGEIRKCRDRFSIFLVALHRTIREP